MDILEIGTSLIQNKFGIDLDNGVVSEALSGLLGGDGGSIDIQGLISQFMGSGG